MWLWNNVPDLFFILTLTARGGLNAEAPAELRNEAWVRRNLLEGHGPLAARYPAIPTLHVVLEVKDRGEPQLTGYRRIVFTIKPVAR